MIDKDKKMEHDDSSDDQGSGSSCVEYEGHGLFKCRKSLIITIMMRSMDTIITTTIIITITITAATT